MIVAPASTEVCLSALEQASLTYDALSGSCELRLATGGMGSSMKAPRFARLRRLPAWRCFSSCLGLDFFANALPSDGNWRQASARHRLRDLRQAFFCLSAGPIRHLGSRSCYLPKVSRLLGTAARRPPGMRADLGSFQFSACVLTALITHRFVFRSTRSL